LQGIPGVTQAHGLYNQFGGGPGGRREFGPPGTIGTMPGPEAGPPAVPVSSRPGGGHADNFYGDTSDPFPSQHYASYPGGPSSGAAPLSPVHHSPRPPHSPGLHHEPTYGYHSPTQPGFPAAHEQPSYVHPSSGFPDPGRHSPYLGGPPPSAPTSTYPGSSYPGQSSYPSQEGPGFPSMPDPVGDSGLVYDGSPMTAPSFPGAAPSFPSEGGPSFPSEGGPSFPSEGGPSFPGPQASGYGSGSYGGYGHGAYDPEY